MLVQLTDNLKLRKLGKKFMIVRSTNGCADMSEVFTLNDTAAFLWKTIEEAGGACEETLLSDKLVEVYGISAETASSDVGDLMNQWQEFGLIVKK